MNAKTFVEECRREWKRLGVPAQVAEEMAAELRADLAEAAADGAPAEDLLGTAAFDARGLAASWASERGVVPKPSPPRRRRTLLVAGSTVTAAAIAVAGAILLASATTTRTTAGFLSFVPRAEPVSVIYTGQRVAGGVVLRSIPSSPPTTSIAATTGSSRRTIGLILLPIGLLALILVTFDAQRPRRRAIRPVSP